MLALRRVSKTVFVTACCVIAQQRVVQISVSAMARCATLCKRDSVLCVSMTIWSLLAGRRVVQSYVNAMACCV